MKDGAIAYQFVFNLLLDLDEALCEREELIAQVNRSNRQRVAQRKHHRLLALVGLRSKPRGQWLCRASSGARANLPSASRAYSLPLPVIARKNTLARVYMTVRACESYTHSHAAPFANVCGLDGVHDMLSLAAYAKEWTISKQIIDNPRVGGRAHVLCKI